MQTSNKLTLKRFTPSSAAQLTMLNSEPFSMSVDYRFQSAAYYEGKAQGVLETLTIIHSSISKKELRQIYYDKLISLKYEPDIAKYWTEFYFDI